MERAVGYEPTFGSWHDTNIKGLLIKTISSLILVLPVLSLHYTRIWMMALRTTNEFLAMTPLISVALRSP